MVRPSTFTDGITSSASDMAHLRDIVDTATEFWVDWDKGADDAVAFLRSEAGRSPHDRVLVHLIGELTTRSKAFAVRWAKHDVKFHRTGVKRLRHPLVGELSLPYEAMELALEGTSAAQSGVLQGLGPFEADDASATLTR